MKCVVCKGGETSPGKTSVTFENEGCILVVRNVPAEVCNNCGEDYVDEKTAEYLMKLAEEAKRSGVQIEVRTYAA